MLIFQVSSQQQAVSDRFYRVLYDSLIDPRLANCSKQAMYLNLLFRAIKAEVSAKRVAAFVKRLSQILSIHQPPFVCGALYLLGEVSLWQTLQAAQANRPTKLFNLSPGLSSMLTEPEDLADIEIYKDITEDIKPSDAAAPEVCTKGIEDTQSTTRYDGRKRDPQYANASNSCLWEITPLLHHFHPSVALHASQLLVGATVTTTPDLELHTISHFLDRFVYRNPKKVVNGKNSLMKPGAAGLDRSGMVLMRKGVSSTADCRVNTEAFVAKDTSQVPVDQLFFHKFFSKKQDESKAQEAKKDKRKRRESDSDGGVSVDGLDEGSESDLEPLAEADDLDESEIWKAMRASMPDAKEEEDADLLSISSDSAGESACSDFEIDTDTGTDAKLQRNDDLAPDEAKTANDKVQKSFSREGDSEDDDLPAFEEAEEDVLGSDEDIQIDLPPQKGTSANGKGRKSKKQKLKHLPAFASADDWADIINAGDSD